MTSTFPIRLRAIQAAVLALLLCGIAAAGGAAGAAATAYVPGEVVVGYVPGTIGHLSADIDARGGARAIGSLLAPRFRVLRLARGVSMIRTIARLRHEPGIAYAVPNFVAHADGLYEPDDRGRTHVRGGWEELQWNFLPQVGVNAPQAWANLIADGHPGGRGVTVAILDTGVAYRNWRQYRKSPDFSGTRFTAPYDFVAGNRFPLDREGHGTFVAGTVAETTNNGFALTGLAYGATIMPVRVLDAGGSGDASTIASGIRYAVEHGARVISLSLEFSPDVSARDIPDILNAIQFAHHRGSVVVGASGNEGIDRLAYPARAPLVISVGATTRDRCLADYSNAGAGLDLVAPGGGDDSQALQDPNCHPERNLPTIYQMTFANTSDPNPRQFGLPDGVFGTSMSTPHVAAAAALVIASGVLGRRPTPSQVLARLEATAQHLGPSWPNHDYGYGLLDAGAATAPIAVPAPGHHG